MIEGEEQNRSPFSITTVYPDKSRRTYQLRTLVTVENLISVILSDNSIAKPVPCNPCIVYEGRVLEKDEFLSSYIENYNVTFYVVFNPYLSNDNRTRTNMQNVNDRANRILWNEIAPEIIDDLAEIFPGVLTRGNNPNDRYCGFINVRTFFTGFFIGCITGPLSLTILPCYEFDLSGILGMCIGVILWVIFFLTIVLRKKTTRRYR